MSSEPQEAALSEAEQNALDFLKYHGGAVLITVIPTKNERGLFGEVTPGLTVFKKLERKGLVIFTEEEPCFLDLPEDDPLHGFMFTPMVELV